MPSHKTTPATVALLSPELPAQARSGTSRKWAAHALCVGADPELLCVCPWPPGHPRPDDVFACHGVVREPSPESCEQVRALLEAPIW